MPLHRRRNANNDSSDHSDYMKCGYVLCHLVKSWCDMGSCETCEVCMKGHKAGSVSDRFCRMTGCIVLYERTLNKKMVQPTTEMMEMMTIEMATTEGSIGHKSVDDDSDDLTVVIAVPLLILSVVVI